MKKQYIAPELTQTVICANEIVCASANINMSTDTTQDAGITSADVKYRDDDFDFDGGSGSDWGDELW